jgi:hypothetical protein
MYTDTGINHVNLYLAGRTTALATHIVMGLDRLNTTGDAAPLVSDRHPAAWEAVRIPIVASSIVDENIVFTSSHDSVKVSEFLANNSSLVYYNDVSGSSVRTRQHVWFDFENGWTGTVALTPSTTPDAWFNEKGGMRIAANTTATLTGSLGLAGYQSADVLSIPVFWTGAAPTGGVLTVTFTFKVGGVDTTYSISDSVATTDGGAHFKFTNGVAALNNLGAILTTQMSNPSATVWQKKLGSGTTPADFLANIATIWKVEIGWSGSAANLYVGAPQLTPDFDGDTSSIVVSIGDLEAQTVNTSEERISAEYRIIGLSKP